MATALRTLDLIHGQSRLVRHIEARLADFFDPAVVARAATRGAPPHRTAMTTMDEMAICVRAGEPDGGADGKTISGLIDRPSAVFLALFSGPVRLIGNLFPL